MFFNKGDETTSTPPSVRQHHTKVVFWAQTHAYVLAPPCWLDILVYIVNSHSCDIELRGLVFMEAACSPCTGPQLHWVGACWGRKGLCSSSCPAHPPSLCCTRQNVSVWAAQCLNRAVPVSAGAVDAQGSVH